MWDGIELWLRRVGGTLLAGLLVTGWGLVKVRWWPPLRVAFFLAGVGLLVACVIETWKLIRSPESAEAQLDRLEAQREAGD
ncbi:hypothetical protein [Streptomyces sp. NPDC059909]|uniref:hypothetical protein n=1 Tax=Streptomyces sp. NPDC059909 TaxID=3346998 RepID=UPI003658DDB3